MRIYINGRFLTRKMTGVERYATELLRAVDELLGERGSSADEWIVLVPAGLSFEDPGFRNIALRKGGRGGGHLWEQASLPLLAADGVLINLANSGPLAHRRSFTVIHDAIVYRMPELFSLRYRTWHGWLGRALSRLSRLGTVSEFSRGEISTLFGIARERILVLPNGSEHLGAVRPDPETLGRLGLEPDRFLLFVGSPAPHKNLARALKAYASLGETGQAFVTVGSSHGGVFGKSEEPLPKGAVATGRLSDAEIAALYASATALVFPSLYEGFGIPPLEAMSYGCPVLAADIPSIREVCGEAVLYFDPRSVEDIARTMAIAVSDDAALGPLVEAGKERLTRFSWRRSAQGLLDAAAAIARP